MNRKPVVIGTGTVRETPPKRPDAEDFLGIDFHLCNEENGTKDRFRSCVRGLGKLRNVREAIEVAREARTVFGGNGATIDYPPMRHMSNLESVRTYEGTDEVHTLILGSAITGIPAFR
jgi:hypothetical protein